MQKTEQQEYPQPRVKFSKTSYAVWSLPLLALALAFWLVYRNYVDAGIHISITFPDASGIIAKKTVVKFKGMEVGRVKSLTVLEDGSGVKAGVEMARETALYLTDKLQFWLVKPNVGLTGISGLETLFSGAYIQAYGDEAVKLGKGSRHFKALVGAPPVDIPKGLLVYQLTTTHAAGVTSGSLVYHRNIRVGTVHGVQLSDDHQSIEVIIAVEPKYQGLVKRASRFWNISGVKASLGLSGMKVESQGIAAMLIGGIAFNSPPASAPAQQYSAFRLYADADAARDPLEIELTFSASADIGVGSPIVLDQQQVGAIDSLKWDDDFKQLLGSAKLSLDMKTLMRAGTQFWLEKPTLSVDNINVGQLIQGTRIRLSPGSGEPATAFIVQNQPSYKKPVKAGLMRTLSSDDSYGLDKGSGVYYQQQQIGEVLWVDFDISSRQFRLDILIYPQYRQLADNNSLFYNLGGVDFNAGLHGVSLTVPSIRQLVSGGIGLYPVAADTSGNSDVEAVKDTAIVVPLHSNLDTALAQLDDGVPDYTLRSVELLSPAVNTPVYYKQFEIGRVSAVTLHEEAAWSTVSIDIEDKFGALIRADSVFWLKSAIDIKASVHGVELSAAPLLSMIGGGIEVGNIAGELSDAPLAEAQQVFVLHRDKAAAGRMQPLIELTIRHQTSLKAGAAVKYRGYTIGEVSSVELLPDLDGIRAMVNINPQYAGHFNRSDSRYWLVQTQARLSSVKNLANSIFGDSLAADKGSGPLQHQFVVDQRNLAYREGLAITLLAGQLGSLNIGAPVLYKQLTIGEISTVQLSGDNQQIAIGLQIDDDYRHLITQGSEFWNASGVSVDAGLFSGVQIDTQTLESIIDGGVALATVMEGEMVKPGHTFVLHKKAKAQWLDGIK